MNEETKQLLCELEKTQNQFWNIAHETANFISLFIKKTKPKNVLEIGTSNGYSAIWIADALKFNANNAHLTTIEFYEERQSIAKKYFEQTGLSDLITPLQGAALELLPEIDFTPDLVFIDANKPQYIDYFNLLKDKIPVDGVILADNVLSHEQKVKPFVDAINSDEHWQAEILPLPAGLLVGVKIK